MKILFISIFLIIVSTGLYSQVPEGFSYSAVVRNSSGDPLGNQAVSFRFSIIMGTAGGSIVYSEIHNIITDVFGSVSLIIGMGTAQTGSFSDIEWGVDNYFLKIELDNTGGTTYTDMGTTQFYSVPYAMYAKTAGNGFSGNYNELTNKPVTDGSETRLVAGNSLTIDGSGTADDPYIINTKNHYIGESYGGGIVFYVYENKQHGLIAASRDQYNDIEWYNGVKRNTNATGDGLKAGEMNTLLIISCQTNDNPMGNFAAKICADYSVTFNGVTFGDWYLPSKLELSLMYLQKDVIGGFKNGYYWSSTEFSSISAWSQNFSSSGEQFNLNKSIPYNVRAIRSF